MGAVGHALLGRDVCCGILPFDSGSLQEGGLGWLAVPIAMQLAAGPKQPRPASTGVIGPVCLAAVSVLLALHLRYTNQELAMHGGWTVERRTDALTPALGLQGRRSLGLGGLGDGWKESPRPA
ncbi:hypothetical protein P280DRAFT_112792 [Massarina eburnea CBS 473.64]|uniref:Uncharacterized protein n=1 Tax=Massarina eburnea CBS 473.64 TaxID=1395130 RepID=A0A6A6RPW9_9PLEO|nr:hypothetical protein P280DRAFT_112792 [Massarina eburnea CBS 473.64]